MKRLLMTVACGLLWFTPAYGQTCTGSLPFTSAQTQVGGQVSFSSNTRNVALGAAKGFDWWFGRGGVDFASLSHVDGSAKGVTVQGGTEFPVTQDKRFLACPLVGITKLWGPNPAETEVSFGTLGLSFGGSVGFEAAQSGSMRIVPTLGASFDYVRSSTDAPGPCNNFGNVQVCSGFVVGSDSTTFGNLNLGAGLIFNDTFAIVPEVIVPFGLDGGETSFAVFFSAKLGH